MPKLSTSLVVTHACYIVGILVFLLIGSLSVNWGTIKDLSAIVSFAVGFASLILAVFAIIQNLVGGPNLASSIDSIRDASSRIISSTLALESAGATMIEKASRMDAVPDQLTGIRALLETRLSQSAEGTGGSTPLPDNAADQVGVTYDPQVTVSAILDTSPPAGVIALYAAAKSQSSGKAIDIRSIKPDQEAMWGFIAGYAAALARSGFLSMTSEGAGHRYQLLGGVEPSVVEEKLDKLMLETDDDLKEFIFNAKAAVDRAVAFA